LYFDKVRYKLLCIDAVLCDLKFQLFRRTFHLLIQTDSLVTSHPIVTQTHDGLKLRPISVALVQFSDRMFAQQWQITVSSRNRIWIENGLFSPS
jgi:hypothetical protein